MLKIAAHVHTLGTSGCAEVSPADVVRLYKKAEYDGIVVTNHYMKGVFEGYYAPMPHERQIEFYIAAYRETKRFADEAGMLAFLGMELNLERYNVPGSTYPVYEFLCYGVTESFLRQNHRLFDLSQEQAFNLLSSNGIAMCQAHPFRTRTRFADPFLMHGAEVFNGNPRHNSRDRVAQAAAKAYDFIEVAGDDFHRPEDCGRAALYVPDGTDTDEKLANALLARETRVSFRNFGAKKWA